MFECLRESLISIDLLLTPAFPVYRWEQLYTLKKLEAIRWEGTRGNKWEMRRKGASVAIDAG